MSKKKRDRKRPTRFLSVVPVTSRETLVPTHRKTNLLAAAKQQLRYAQQTVERKKQEIARLEAAIKALQPKS